MEEVNTGELRDAYWNIKRFLEKDLQKFDVVQLNENTKNDKFIGAFMTVTDTKSWGVQGYVQCPGQGQAYYRAENGTFDWIGNTQLIISDEVEE